MTGIKFYIVMILALATVSYSQADFEIDKYLDGTIVNDIENDGNFIWFATEGRGIYRYTKATGEWDNYSSANNGLEQDYLYCLTSNKDFVWAGSVDGLFILDKKRNRWTKRKFSKGGQLSNWIRALAYDPYENAVWIGRFQYLSKYDIQRRRFIDYDLTTSGDQKTNMIKTVAVDGDSLVWFGTEGGLHKYDKSKDLETPGAVVFYDSKLNYFNGDGDKVSITGIVFEQNNVWIGLDEFRTENNPNYNIGGLYKFNRRNEWYRFDNTLGFQANGVFALEKVGDYILAAVYQFGKDTKATYGRGIAIINRSTLELSQVTDNRLPNKILSMMFDGEYLWLGSDSGIYRVKLMNDLAVWNNKE